MHFNDSLVKLSSLLPFIVLSTTVAKCVHKDKGVWVKTNLNVAPTQSEWKVYIVSRSNWRYRHTSTPLFNFVVQVCLFVCFFIKHCPPFMILLVRIQRRNFSITCHHLPQKKGDYLGEYFQRYSKKFSVFLLVLFFSVWKPILINLSTQNQTQNAFSVLSGSQILTASLWIAFHGYILHAFQTALLPQQRW